MPKKISRCTRVHTCELEAGSEKRGKLEKKKETHLTWMKEQDTPPTRTETTCAARAKGVVCFASFREKPEAEIGRERSLKKCTESFDEEEAERKGSQLI